LLLAIHLLLVELRANRVLEIRAVDPLKSRRIEDKIIMVNQYKSGAVLPTRTIYKPVYAESMQFPIETKAFRIVYEQKSGTYYAFIAGARLDEFVFNRDNAKLALKSALSLENLCNVKVIYASTGKLEIPDKFQDSGC